MKVAFGVIAATVVLAAPPAAADTAVPLVASAHPEARPFGDPDRAGRDVAEALARARINGHRVILVFGANWCHDSRALAGWFATPRFAAMLSPRYEIVWIDVGQKDRNLDLARRFGLEGIKGTPTVPPGEFSKIVARNGGRDNAFTSQDYTAYFQNVARDRLELVMRMEADRMTNLRLTDAEVLQRTGVTPPQRGDLGVAPRARLVLQEHAIRRRGDTLPPRLASGRCAHGANSAADGSASRRAPDAKAANRCQGEPASASRPMSSTTWRRAMRHSPSRSSKRSR